MINHTFSRRNILKFIGATGLAGIVPVVGPRIARAKSGKMQLFVGTAPHFGNIIVADEKGYFKDAGLDVELTTFASGSIGCEAFAGGSGSGADCGDLGALKLFTGNGIGKAICPTARSGEWSIVVGSKGIDGPEDMRGKRVGVLLGSTSEYFAKIYFATAGIDISEVDLINLRPPEMATGLVQKQIDAFILWEPFGTRVSEATSGEARVIDTGGKYFTEWMISVANREYLESSRDELVAYVKGLHAASKWCNENQEEAADVYSRRMKVKELEISRQMFKAAHWTVAYTPKFREDLEKLAKFIDVQVDWQAGFDHGILQEADPALVQL